MIKEDMKDIWDEAGYNINDCTCNKCPDKDTCKFSFDLYNTDEDCLASK